MTSRRTLLAAASAFGLMSPWMAFAQEQQERGPYRTLPNRLNVSNDKIDVTVFFSYACPHCLQFEPHMEKWIRRKKPADVQVTYSPVSWQQETVPFSLVFYALKQLGWFDRLSLPFFESVVYQTRIYKFETLYQDIDGFMQRNKKDLDAWHNALHDPAVIEQTKDAIRRWQDYRIDSTPMVAVDGHYVTSPYLAKGNKQTIAMVEELIAKVRAERKA